MACPFFEPLQPHSPRPDPATAMLPLGDLWHGACHADPGHPTPAEDSPRQPLCNLGYARISCPRFPGGDCADAVRFMIASDSADGIRVRYSIERDHHPVTNGV